MSAKLGTERPRITIVRDRLDDGTFHVEGERIAGEADCPRCGKRIELTQDVDEYEPETGRVTDWGPAQGVCECGILVVVSWEGCEVFDLRKKPRGAT
jgi:hypothetical protein